IRILLVTCHLSLVTLSLIQGPAMLANQRHKLARSVFFDLVSTFGFDRADQLLRFFCFSNRNDQTTAGSQLRYQGLWYARSAGGDQNSIVGSVGIPAERPVKCFDRRVVDSQLAQAPLCFACQLA